MLGASVALNVLLLSVLGLGLWTVSRTKCPAAADARHDQKALNGDLKKTSSYSPLLDLVNLEPHAVRFNGRLHDNTSIYRLDPSPEVDKAWDDISAEGFEVITVDEAAVLQSGKSPRLSVKAPESWGLGDGAYLAQVDVFHQIHCLNELRKEIHFDYYYGGDGRLNGTSRPADHLHHKKHCIHMLLQNLMCHADVDIITHNWVHYEHINQPNRPYAEPFADFNLVKQCRNFDALLEWTRKNALDKLAERWHGLEKPEGTEIVQGDGYFWQGVKP
ncbi:hypothetical protein RJ55_07454 [Drechmeria coniospora]|nr:hypothetical protein RJ55_07454 [Drechmeria coniospora]